MNYLWIREKKLERGDVLRGTGWQTIGSKVRILGWKSLTWRKVKGFGRKWERAKWLTKIKTL